MHLDHEEESGSSATANVTNTKNWARGGKANGQGARGNYKGKAENYDLDYHKRFKANHVNSQQQQLPDIMPPPYMYQANSSSSALESRSIGIKLLRSEHRNNAATREIGLIR